MTNEDLRTRQQRGKMRRNRPHRRGSRSPAASSPWRECVARRWRQNVQEIGLSYGAPLPTHDESAIVGASATRRKEFGSRLLPKTRHTTAPIADSGSNNGYPRELDPSISAPSSPTSNQTVRFHQEST